MKVKREPSALSEKNVEELMLSPSCQKRGSAVRYYVSVQIEPIPLKLLDSLIK